MPEGSRSYKGLAVPLYGESEIFQETAATDILTMTAVTGATGDFLVCQTAGGGEVFVVKNQGYISFGAPPTTPPTTGLDQWDLFVVAPNGGTAPQLALCTSGNTLIYAVFTTNTFGRTTDS